MSTPSNGARFDRVQFRIRLGIVLALSLGAALVPAVGDQRLVVAGFLAVVVFPLHLVIRWISRSPNPTGWLDLLAIGAASGTAMIEPAAFAPALLFQMLNVSGSVAFLTPTWTRHLAAVSVTSMTMVIAVRPVDSAAIPMMVVAVVFLPALIVGASQKLAKEMRSTHRVQAIVDGLPLLVWEADRDGSIRSVVGDVERVLGRSRQDVLGTGYLGFVHPSDRPALVERLSNATTASLTYRFERSDGDTVWISDQIRATDVRGDRILRGVSIDVTAERRAQQSVLRQSEIVRRMSAATLILAAPSPGEHPGSCHILSATDALGHLGAHHDQLEGRRLSDVLPDLSGAPWIDDAVRRIEQASAVHLPAQRLHRADGTTISADLQVFGLAEDMWALIIDDVSERERSQALIQHQATHDDLTGLSNRPALMAEVRRRLDNGDEFSLAVLDLNGFREVNDALGHSTGDELLCVIARRLDNAAGDNDFVARLGGDEFGIVMDRTEPLDLRLTAVGDACRSRVSLAGSALAVGASIGVASAPHNTDDAETLLRMADIAMYDAKRLRHSFRHFIASDDEVPERLDLMAELQDAFVLGQFVPWFQPQYAANGDLVAAEALVRWEHPVRGVLQPGRFMELIGLAGHHDDLLSAVLWGTLETMALLPDDMSLSFNVSAVNLRHPDLVDRITAAVFNHDVTPSRLTIELTEAEIADETGALHRSLDSLADLGFGVAVDDFGTGYSSLTHLQTLPLTELKIDRRFISNLQTSNADRAIVRALIKMAHDLGVSVVAEGVDSPEIATLLRSVACDRLQGYHLGRPMPADAFVQLVEERRRARSAARLGPAGIDRRRS